MGKGKRISESDLATFCELANGGHGPRAIATTTGWSEITVRRYLGRDVRVPKALGGQSSDPLGDALARRKLRPDPAPRSMLRREQLAGR